MATTYEPIATTTLGSAAASVTFSSISGSYTDLVLVCRVIAATNAGGQNLLLQFNSDTGSNYSFTWMYGDGTSATSSRQSNQTSMGRADFYTTTRPTATIIQIQNYSNSTTYKTALWRNGVTDSGAGTRANVGLWRSTSAIDSITIKTDTGNFGTDSMFTLYGIKAA
jgi:hypothetical protein